METHNSDDSWKYTENFKENLRTFFVVSWENDLILVFICDEASLLEQLIKHPSCVRRVLKFRLTSFPLSVCLQLELAHIEVAMKLLKHPRFKVVSKCSRSEQCY
jgi:hypothetical protein